MSLQKFRIFETWQPDIALSLSSGQAVLPEPLASSPRCPFQKPRGVFVSAQGLGLSGSFQQLARGRVPGGLSNIWLWVKTKGSILG